MKEKTFEVKEEHLKLIENMNVGWQNCEFGAPEIDPKRPYGNSDVYGDMVEIFGLNKVRGNLSKVTLLGKEYFVVDGEIEDELKNILMKLYRETETVLQIALVTRSFKAGIYKLDDEYGIKWKWVE